MGIALVVDDEPAILRMLSLMLKNLDYEAVAAPDAERALGCLDAVHPDVVITDVRLPGMDGVELARRIKADERFKDVPVVLISAFGRPDWQRARVADAFLPKPFDIDTLADTLPGRRHA